MVSRISVAIVFLLLSVDSLHSQHLPEGTYQSNRERTFDILHYRAELAFDMVNKEISGTATIRMTPLKTIESFALDAFQLNVTDVRISGRKLQFVSLRNSLVISLSLAITPSDTVNVEIQYSASPRAGMYFRPDQQKAGCYYISTYGEGGLHANWLPIYNDVNDKFSSEMIVKVPREYTVISNGRLLDTQPTKDDQMIYHWSQKLPHSNYLIAVYVGRFEKGDLPSAFGTIPLSYWVPPGRLKDGAYAFRNTTKMVEFFSERFGFRYPWDKYDQIAVPDYAIGAMEHTGVTGHSESVLRDDKAPQDFDPTLDDYADDWHADATISHELAHHWFGDNLTCRNLSNIWLNESFASYAMMLWDEHAVGKDFLLFQADVARQHYVKYVHTANIIRPLEYHYFDDPNTIYNEEHTYLKGAVILHMMRSVLGDEAFFRSIRYYLNKHQFQNVESQDLKIAIEEASGRNLDWFFEQWITGAGHPQFRISYKYLADQKAVDLLVTQVQAEVEGQGIFTLPVNITLATRNRTWSQPVWVENQSDHLILPCDEEPLMVSFDGEGDLVSEIDFQKSEEELIYQAKKDAVPGRLRAIRQLAERYATSARTVAAFKDLLGDPFWGIAAETAFQLGTMRTPDAERLTAVALKADDYRVRKAAVLALAKFQTSSAASALQQVAKSDKQDDVAAVALISLARINPSVDPGFIRSQMKRQSWSDEMAVGGLKALGELASPKLVDDIKPYVADQYNRFVRAAALTAWSSCNSSDKNLHQVVIGLLNSPILSLQLQAIGMVGDLNITEAFPKLHEFVDGRYDANLVVAANNALQTAERRKIE